MDRKVFWLLLVLEVLVYEDRDNKEHFLLWTLMAAGRICIAEEEQFLLEVICYFW